MVLPFVAATIVGAGDTSLGVMSVTTSMLSLAPQALIRQHDDQFSALADAWGIRPK